MNESRFSPEPEINDVHNYFIFQLHSNHVKFFINQVAPCPSHLISLLYTCINITHFIHMLFWPLFIYKMKVIEPIIKELPIILKGIFSIIYIYSILIIQLNKGPFPPSFSFSKVIQLNNLLLQHME